MLDNNPINKEHLSLKRLHEMDAHSQYRYTQMHLFSVNNG